MTQTSYCYTYLTQQVIEIETDLEAEAEKIVSNSSFQWCEGHLINCLNARKIF